MMLSKITTAVNIIMSWTAAADFICISHISNWNEIIWKIDEKKWKRNKWPVDEWTTRDDNSKDFKTSFDIYWIA